MPHGYGYGNARLRAKRSRLLTGADYNSLLAKTTVEELITALAETPYKENIEAALLRTEGVRCIYEAVRTHLVQTLLKIRHFFEGEPQRLIDLLLRRWDRHNLLAILRGQSQEASAETVMSVIVPVGQLDPVALRELARQPGLRAALDLMTTWRLPYARVLRQLQARDGALPDLDQLELALNRFHYASIMAALAGRDHNHRLVRSYFQVKIDLVNLATALRLVHLPNLDLLLRRRYQSEDARPLLIEPGGYLSSDTLVRVIAEAGGIEAMVGALSTSRYGPALLAGWQRYQAGEGDLEVFERALERWQAERTVALFRHDPLSVAIPIAYIEAKQLEVVNLRLIAQGVAWGAKPEQIRPNLIILE